MTRHAQDAKVKAHTPVKLAAALENVGYAKGRGKSGTCQRAAVGARHAKAQAYVIPVVDQVGMVVRYVEALGF